MPTIHAMQEEKIYLYSRQDWKNDRKVTYPGGLIIDNVYDAGTGNLKKIVRQHDNMTIWEGIEYNKHGQLTFSIKGGIKQIMEYYPETGYLKSVTAPGMQSFGYHYDPLGNMDHRYDHLHEVNGQSLHEQFYYDRGNQLTGTYLNGTLASHIIYDNLGNITSKTATGGFEYQSGNSPYRLTAIVPDQNSDPGYKLSQNITYTDFNKVESITGNGYKLEIEYGLENQRISQSLSSVNQYGLTNLLLKKHFTGGLQEKIFYETGAEKTISYITSPEGLTAIEVKSGITSEWYTVFTDHLGSITTLVRESDGSRFELSYDAWGNRRNPATWVNYSGNLPDFITITDTDFITDRGFTGHEHLDMFGLINMNGRVYDPVASRFLSPDSFIQTPELALNYNGYVYCLNNPLIYKDPDGEFFFLIPNISLSKNGGLSIGISAVVGIPNVFSAQTGMDYNFKNNDLSAYVGASAAFNTVYVSASTQSGFSVGWSLGISPYMGFPVSTNFTSLGVNYNITHDSWSGNLSAWQIDKSGWTFNPSLSVMVYPERTTNLVRGQGFRNNSGVFNKMMQGDYTCQDILDYFGFEGTYSDEEGESHFWFNKTDHSKYGIRYTDGAFYSYDALRSTNMKETYHMRRFVKKGKNGLEFADCQESEYSVMPEERLGVIHQYKNRGLYRGDPYNFFQGIKNTESYIDFYNNSVYQTPYSYKPYTSRWWHFIYKIPRKW